MSALITVVTVRSGVAAVEQVDPGLTSMQAIVGGYLEAVPLRGQFRGLIMWVNEEGRLAGLPARPCPLWTAEPNIAGDYFVARSKGGETASLTVADIALLKGVLS